MSRNWSCRRGPHDGVHRGERFVHQHDRAGRPPAPAPHRRADAGRRTARRVALEQLVVQLEQLASARGRARRCAARSQPRSDGTVAMLCARSGAASAPRSGSRSRCRGELHRVDARASSRPPTRISPEVGSISRLIIRIVVVLPQPDGPTSTSGLALGDVERQIADGRRGRVREPLRDIANGDHRAGHGGPPQDGRWVGDRSRVYPSVSGKVGESSHPVGAEVRDMPDDDVEGRIRAFWDRGLGHLRPVAVARSLGRRRGRRLAGRPVAPSPTGSGTGARRRGGDWGDEPDRRRTGASGHGARSFGRNARTASRQGGARAS